MSIFLPMAPAVMGIFLLVALMEYKNRTRPAPSLERVADIINGSVSYGWEGACVGGFIDEAPVGVVYRPKRRKYLLLGRPSSLTIFTPKDVPGAFTVVHKLSHRAPDLPLLNTPLVEAGNTLFDKEFSVHSPYESFVKTNFKDGEKRQAIRRIFTMEAKWVCFDGKSFSAGWEPFDPEVDLDEKTLREIVARLHSLGKNLQPANDISEEKESRVLSFLLAALALFLATVALSLILLRYL